MNEWAVSILLITNVPSFLIVPVGGARRGGTVSLSVVVSAGVWELFEQLFTCCFCKYCYNE